MAELLTGRTLFPGTDRILFNYTPTAVVESLTPSAHKILQAKCTVTSEKLEKD